jgi:hypothetical protein
MPIQNPNLPIEDPIDPVPFDEAVGQLREG